MLDLVNQQQQQFTAALAQQQVLMFQFLEKAQQMDADKMATFKSMWSASYPSKPSGATLAAGDASASAKALKESEKEVLVVLDKEKMKFKKKVKTFLRSKDTLKARTLDVETIEKDATQSVLPKNVRPFKPLLTEGELDEAWSQTLISDKELVFKFEKGSSMRKVLEESYWYMIKLQKDVLKESADRKVGSLEAATRKAAFSATCLEALAQVAVDDAAALGLESVSKPVVLEAWIDEKIKNMFNDVVEGTMKEKKAEDELTSRKIKKEEVNDAMANLKPEQALSSFVDKRVVEALKDKMVEGGDMDMAASASGTSDDMDKLKNCFSMQWPKNGSGGSGPPRGKKRQPSTAKPFLGAPNWKNQGKGKGKDSGQWQGQWQRPDAKGDRKGGKGGGKTGGQKGKRT